MWLWTPLLLSACVGLPDSEADGADAEYVDVVVIGAGAAGLAAAGDAVAAGAEVVVLEREAEAGGAANVAGGLMLFSGTPEQRAAGVIDSPAQLSAEWQGFTGGDVSDPWFQFFAEQNIPMVYDYLAALGVRWIAPEREPSAGDTPRVQPVEGQGTALVAALLDAALDSGPGVASVRYGARADELLIEGGRVAGVRWSDDEGAHTLLAGATIVATGGFLRDLDRVRAAVPELGDAPLSYASWVGADGNGLTMLEDVGATTQNLGAVGFYAHGFEAPVEGVDEVVSSIVGESPWVNAAAQRFCDESGVNSFVVGRTRALQPAGVAWMVADQRIEDAIFADPSAGGAVYRLSDMENAGRVTRSDSLTGLADAIGVDADIFGAEIADYNAASETGDAWRSAPGVPVVEPPFYALPVAISVAKAFGGVDVDLQGRVLDSAGRVLPGVYAAGELTGMLGGSIVGEYGFTGSLTAVVLGGRVAGQYAAAEALSR
jgi:predicted oxidoreductase